MDEQGRKGDGLAGNKALGNACSQDFSKLFDDSPPTRGEWRIAELIAHPQGPPITRIGTRRLIHYLKHSIHIFPLKDQRVIAGRGLERRGCSLWWRSPNWPPAAGAEPEETGSLALEPSPLISASNWSTPDITQVGW